MKNLFICLLLLSSLPSFSAGIHESDRLGYGFLEPSDFESKIEWSLRSYDTVMANRVTDYYFDFYSEEKMPKSPDVFYWAVLRGDIRLIQRLIKAGWDVNTLDNQLGQSPLQANWGSNDNKGTCNPAILRLLIENGADINAETSEGTVLDSLYRRCGSTAPIEILFREKDLNINSFSIYGRPFVEEMTTRLASDNIMKSHPDYSNVKAFKVLELILKGHKQIDKETLERSLIIAKKIGNSDAINLISERLKM